MNTFQQTALIITNIYLAASLVAKGTSYTFITSLAALWLVFWFIITSFKTG